MAGKFSRHFLGIIPLCQTVIQFVKYAEFVQITLNLPQLRFFYIESSSGQLTGITLWQDSAHATYTASISRTNGDSTGKTQPVF